MYAQKDSCKAKLTEAEVIKIAKKKHAYRDKKDEPMIYFSNENCEWHIQSIVSRKTVMRNRMQHVKLTYMTIDIDAETGKVKSRERDVHLVPANEP